MRNSFLLPLNLIVATIPLDAFVLKGPSVPIGTSAEPRQRCSELWYKNDPDELMTLPHNPLFITESIPKFKSDPLRTHTTGVEPKNKHDVAWNSRFNDLCKFHAIHGHSDVPYNYASDPNLAVWVTYQRRARKQNKLVAERIAALDQIDFTWTPRTPWRRRYAELAEFKRRNGHCAVPYNYKENPALGVWLNNQKQQYRALCLGHDTHITEKRVAALVSLGAFDEEDRRDNAWSSSYRELMQYKEEFGCVDVPRSYGKLGRWVDTQRCAYRLRISGKASPMTDDRIAMLNEIQFNWDPSEKLFSKRLEELKNYTAKHGVDNVAPEDSDDFRQLHAWILTQQAQYALLEEGKKSTLTPERIEALEQAGIEWDPQKFDCSGGKKRSRTPWGERYNELKKFQKEHGHLSVPRRSSLGEWVKAQKRQYKLMKQGGKSSMTRQRFEKLESLGLLAEKIEDKDESNPEEEKHDTQSVIETAYVAPFIEVTMSDDEKLAAWRERFKQFR
uniref:Helicase-associated domain-containing protein n=1 Tax=Pseudictyota dubia TaxID=2749911 RepID=A0A7R9VYN5_9STRA|mmetsp:Transcript_26171/g.48751  ORF Transcript_26171/g.48751 Transcript_26171/m.48751 type:complete len:502 (+) Transcript_26171:138-1643(+)|eukprot:CAMPEP_0197455792 /NCGR_PEP_ID=MMETSP1175-20131217/41645_1 /TAXON_ID=1003142 /ORGANISM="Triceratium dubium, Strain CCMP147" /LENGTH=501 /DNA_ID=CAMNT_0042989741 /DNA_START=55 /DNA_END=1560 /DNA_ORIENTATION=-